MAWGDLFDVTDSLMNLLTMYINNVVSPSFGVTLVATPPDQVSVSMVRTLSLYLHHVRETPYTQNRPGPGSDHPNIATAPLGLDLFYVLTAHHRTGNTFDATLEQRMMGFAMKALHDNPVVTDATRVSVGGIMTPVFKNTLMGRGNRLNVELRKIDPEQALAIWTTGDRQFARLGAYYQVSLVLLEPEPARQFPGVVLALGSFVHPSGSVTLTGSRSDLRFVLPLSGGGTAQVMRADPARAGLTNPASADGDFQLLGHDVTTGLRRRLLLRNARWARLPQPLDRVVVDPALNAATGWAVSFTPDTVNIRAAGRLTYQPATGGPQTIDVFPGTYVASVETVVDDRVILNTPRAFTITSNEIALALTPRIVNHVLNIPLGTITINLDPAFPLVVPAPQGPLDIQVIVDGLAYALPVPPNPPVAGEFTVQLNAITVFATFALAIAGEHTVRLSVDGADAQPYWVQT